MKPTITAQLPEADVLFFRKARKIFLEFPDEFDLGKDEDGREMVLSSHIFARGLGRALGLRVIDGYFHPFNPHSWLVTPHGNIIDVYPAGILCTPMMVHKTETYNSATNLYKPQKVSGGWTGKASFRRAVNMVGRRAEQILEWSRFDRLPPQPKFNDPRPLQDQFPMLLPFAHQADEWLKLIETKGIFWQLENRHIRSFSIMPLISTAGVGIEKSGGLCVYWNTHCDLKYCFESLGHEIAHTFHLDLTKDPPVETIDQQSRQFMYDFDAEGHPHGFYLEDFCDAFSMKWMAINSKERVTLDCKSDHSLLAPVLQLFSDASDRTLTP